MEEARIISQEVAILQSRFSPPTHVKFHFHQHKGVKSQCCQSAYAILHGTIVAAAATGGINNVIQYFTSYFNWGCFPCKHYCEALKHANELFCTGTMIIGLESLGIYRSLCPSPPQFDLVVVELILQLSSSSIQDNLDNISTAKNTYKHRIINTRWLLNHTCYHNLVGIVDKYKNLTLCDYNAKFLFQQHENNSINKILAIRISPWLNNNNKMTFLSMHRQSHQHSQFLKWNARLLPLHSWTQIAASNSHSHSTELIYRQVKLLASLYKTQNMHTISDISEVEASIDSSNADFEVHSDRLIDASEELEVIVLITGIYMGTNPCPGVGVARALRVYYGAHTLQLIGLDNCQTSDPVFDIYLPLTDDGAEAVETETLQDSWKVIEREINLIQEKQQNSNKAKNIPIFYIPCRDRDVEVAAAALDTAGGQGEGILGILCPCTEIVESTRKPSIPAVTHGPLCKFFRIPEYYSMRALPEVSACTDVSCPLSTTTVSCSTLSNHQLQQQRSTKEVSLFELKLFADRIGYPVLVKGAVQGAAVCASWSAVRLTLHTQQWAQGGYLQKPIRGWEKCIAFAAYAGKLLGCCLMTKGTYTVPGKVWSGDIEPVPLDIYMALKEFVFESDWTGGGEIEFIEEITSHNNPCFVQTPQSVAANGFHMSDPVSVLGEYSSTATRWLVDFNPRFPAWVFAATYADCNLPALLVRAATQDWMMQEKKGANNITATTEYYNTRASNGDIHPSMDSAAKNVHHSSFLRSVIEIPVVHSQHTRKLPSFLNKGQTRCQKGGKGAANAAAHKGLFPYPVLPSVCGHALTAHEQGHPTVSKYHSLYEDLKILIDEAVDVVNSGQQWIHTPKYLLCNRILKNNLCKLRNMLTEAARESGIEVQLCLSVKTQPSTALLKAALQEGYMAECIDLAEVYHSVLDAGFPWERIVLTGPAKWWDCKAPSERRRELIEVLSQEPSATAVHLHGVFADSLADLRDIAMRFEHKPEHSCAHSIDSLQPLDTTVIGIRWSPIWSVKSRFGLDCQNAHIVQQAAEVIRSLPVQYKLGMHFHHAPSVLGMQQWLGLVQGFVVFCKEFEELSGRCVATLDFGGGFEAHYLDTTEALEQMQTLFHCVSNTWRSSNTSIEDLHMPIVQFELGKCVSESAGGVLTRVLSTRECYETDGDNNNSESSFVQAVIVDTTIADISVPNSRAVFWLQPYHSSTGQPNTIHSLNEPQHTFSIYQEEVNQATPCMDNTEYRCRLLGAGNTEIWGRTCMEWDRLVGNYNLPPELRTGDLLLIAGSGAYDMSMQYDFGDGVPRTQNVLQF